MKGLLLPLLIIAGLSAKGHAEEILADCTSGNRHLRLSVRQTNNHIFYHRTMAISGTSGDVIVSNVLVEYNDVTHSDGQQLWIIEDELSRVLIDPVNKTARAEGFYWKKTPHAPIPWDTSGFHYVRDEFAPEEVWICTI